MRTETGVVHFDMKFDLNLSIYHAKVDGSALNSSLKRHKNPSGFNPNFVKKKKKTFVAFYKKKFSNYFQKY